jgi:hypothetical protein
MNFKRDGLGQVYLEWEVGPGGFKRAWVQHREPDKDWANAPGGRYLNVVRVTAYDTGPAGNATDFPIFSKLSDQQILLAFVTSVCAITGCVLEND